MNVQSVTDDPAEINCQVSSAYFLLNLDKDQVSSVSLQQLFEIIDSGRESFDFVEHVFLRWSIEMKQFAAIDASTIRLYRAASSAKSTSGFTVYGHAGTAMRHAICRITVTHSR